jgi:WD40 repeat protein
VVKGTWHASSPGSAVNEFDHSEPVRDPDQPYIFVSYRRADDTHFTGRLCDALISEFGAGNVFRDIDSIPAGAVFSEVIENRLADVDVLVAIIGPEWASRLNDSDDFVRLEIGHAIQSGRTVLPVLIEDTPMPRADSLPDDLRQLVGRNAARVQSDPHFKGDISRVIEGIRYAQARSIRQPRAVEAIGVSNGPTFVAPPPGTPIPAPKRRSPNTAMLVAACAVVFAGIVAIAAIKSRGSDSSGSTTPASSNAVTVTDGASPTLGSTVPPAATATTGAPASATPAPVVSSTSKPSPTPAASTIAPGILDGQTKRVLNAQWSPDGSRIATSGDDGTIRLWDPATDRQVGPVRRAHTKPINAIAWSKANGRFASLGEDGLVAIWTRDDVAPVATIVANVGTSKSVSSLTWSPDGREIATSGEDGLVRVWNATTGAARGQPFRGHSGGVATLDWSPDGRMLVSAGDDGTARMWDAQSGAEVRVLRGHKGKVTTARWSPDGTLVATVGEDLTIRLWVAATGALTHTMKGHSQQIIGIRWSPDNTRLVSYGFDQYALVHAVTDGSVVATLTGHTDLIDSAMWSSDGAKLATASKDTTVRVWNASTGAQIGAPLTGHTDWVGTVAWSPDQRALVSASDDGTARIWPT